MQVAAPDRSTATAAEAHAHDQQAYMREPPQSSTPTSLTRGRGGMLPARTARLDTHTGVRENAAARARWRCRPARLLVQEALEREAGQRRAREHALEAAQRTQQAQRLAKAPREQRGGRRRGGRRGRRPGRHAQRAHRRREPLQRRLQRRLRGGADVELLSLP